MKNPVFALLIVSIPALLSSCSQYMVSPLNTLSNPYTPTPMKQADEPSKTETYAGLTVSPGGFLQNDYNDFFTYGSLRLAQSHAFSFLRASYSGNLMAGAVHVTKGDGVSSEEEIYRQQNGGNLFSGAIGVNGALSGAISSRSGRGEWRILGLQASVFNEFGAFQTFRKNFPLVSASYVDRKTTYWTAGLFTEFIRRNRNDKFFGMKFALSFSSFPNPWDENDDSFEGLPTIPRYFSFTPFFGKGNGSGFIQANFGTDVSNVQMGFMLNLRAFRKEDK